MTYRFEYTRNPALLIIHTSEKFVESLSTGLTHELVMLLGGAVGVCEAKLGPYQIFVEVGRVFDRERVGLSAIEVLKMWCDVNSPQTEWIRIADIHNDHCSPPQLGVSGLS